MQSGRKKVVTENGAETVPVLWWPSNANNKSIFRNCLYSVPILHSDGWEKKKNNFINDWQRVF